MKSNPDNLRQRNECIKNYISEDYYTLFVRYDGDLTNELKNVDYACAIPVGFSAYIVCVQSGSLQDFFNKFTNILNIESSFPYTLSELQPAVAANITRFHNENYLGLRGRGTVAAIIDTGIDYLNPQFINDDNTSRIRLIWDQNIESDAPQYSSTDFYGTVYTREQINEAIALKLSGGDPYSIVPSRDTLGHGTNMAGLVGARGINGVTGGAPECEFIIIKLKEEKTLNLKLVGILDRKGIPIYGGIDIFNALNFISEYHDKNIVPVSVLLSCGTNWTSHQGMSSLEVFINFLSSKRGFIVVTNTGNQGASETHASGTITKTGEISAVEVSIAQNEMNFVVLVWVPKPNRMSVSIISPTGEVITPLQPSSQAGQAEEVKLILENSIITFNYTLADVTNGNEIIYISIQNPKGGIWQLRLTGEYIVNGNFNIWLPQRPLIMPRTRFIKSNPYVTLQSPCLAKKAITTSFYDQNNNTLALEAGRGFTASGGIKPNLTTGGVDAITTGLNNETVILSGGSVAGAVLCSATLLLFQWGMVLDNDPNISPTSIISYLTRGTSKRPGDIYPNPQWGYGMLNLQGSFENLRSSNMRSISNNTINEIDSLPENSLIKMPMYLYSNLDD